MALLRPLARFWTAILGCTAVALALAGAARLLMPHAPWLPAPALVAATPPDGATDVLPRSAITLRFNGPMNRVAAAQALRIEPATPGELRWSDDATTLTFQPAALVPSVTYTVSLDRAALSRWWQPLADDALLRFSTAPQPAVVAAMPARDGAPLDTSLAVVFSQAMVPPEAVGAPAALPALRLTPPLSLTARWADQRTLLLRPAAPLAPATRYRAELDADLADLRGVELGAPFRWDFVTAWPNLVEQSPPDGARWVSPRTPLTLRLDAPLDAALIERALRITPPVDGVLSAAPDGAGQLISFVPRDGWAYGTSYRVELVEPAGSGLGAPPPGRWSFEVGPRPRLLAFFPGQGQLLAPGQPIRLVFSSPMDEASLRAGLSIEPAVGELPLTIRETELRLAPELRPSTLYTVTIAAGTPDRSGEPLAAPVQVRLRTAPSRPALDAPGAFAGVVTLPVSRTASVALASTNLSALDLSLYSLDQQTLLLALDLPPEQRRLFSPERYGQPLARSWRQDRSDPLDQPALIDLPVGLNDGEPLAPGAYFLRAVSPEGPRADLLLLVASARLTMRQSPGATLLWATDSATGQPVGGLPVALFGAGSPLARGATAADGTLVLAPGDEQAAPITAVAEAGGPAVVRADWLADGPPAAAAHTLLVAPDRLSYAPGATVAIGGIARRSAPEGGLTLPAADTPCRLQLRDERGVPQSRTVSCATDPASGLLRGELLLPSSLRPGGYVAAVQLGDAAASVPLRVAAPPSAQRRLDLSARPGPAALSARLQADGLPLAGAVISWSLQLEPLAAPAVPPDFALGPLAPGRSLSLAGTASTDADGAFQIALPEGDPAPLPRRYLLRVERGGDAPGSAEAQGLIAAPRPLVAVRFAQRVVASDRRSQVELLAVDGLGRPAPGARIGVEVRPVGATGAPLLVRLATAGADGRAAVELVQLNPGAYELRASADGGPPTRELLWVYGGRFAGWDVPAGRVELVADRSSYRPGDVATLLVAAPTSQANLLLTVERGGILASQVRALRAGQVITLAISPDMAPAVAVGAVLADGDGLRTGGTQLRVEGDAPGAAPAIAIATEQADYLPGATATISVTAPAGAEPLADAVVTLAPELDEASGSLQPAPLLTSPPALSPVATLPAGAPAPAAPATLPALPSGTIALALREPSGAPGLLVGQATLPGEPGRWRLTAYSGVSQLAAASSVITTSRPLAVTLVSPPALRPGDRAEALLTLRNTSATTREVQVSLAATGLTLQPAGAPPPQSLAPGASGVVRWGLVAQDAAGEHSLRVSIDTPGQRQALSRPILITAAPAPAAREQTVAGQGPLVSEIDLGGASGALELALAPGARAALADQARALATLPAPGTDDRAALALIAAALASGAPPDEAAVWQQLARQALDALGETQNPDGGWGWRPDAPSTAFVTAFVVEAQAAAQGALDDAPAPSLRAVAYLRRVAPAAPPDTAAYLAYALARAGLGADSLPDGRRPAELLDADLSAAGLAFVAQALPPAGSRQALDQLGAMADREGDTASWAGDEAGGLPGGPAGVTAAALQALAQARPDDPLLAPARRALLQLWGVDGWPTSYDAARAAAALLPAADAPGPRTLALGDEPLIDAGAPLSGTVRLARPVAGLGPQATLTVDGAADSRFLLATRVGAPAVAVDGLAIDQELVDPTSGAALDPATVRLGQLVAVRVTAVVQRQLLRAELQLALPGGLEPVASPLRPPFLFSRLDDAHRLTLVAADLAPGVYTQTLLARAVAPGQYSAPPARLFPSFAPESVALAPAGIAITISE